MTASTNNAYFDLNNYVRSQTCVEVAAQMAQSVAFGVDIAINSAVRALFKNLRAHHLAYGVESLSDMTMALEGEEFAEEVMRQAGRAGTDDLGPVAAIAELNMIRDEWHELASELTSMTHDWQGVPRTYEIKPIEEMLLREVKLQVKPLTAHRLRVQVERRAGDASKEDIDAVYAKRLAREEQRAKDTARALTEQQGAIVTLYRLASELVGELNVTTRGHVLVDIGDKGDLEDETKLRRTIVAHGSDEPFSFHHLDASLRRQLIEAAMRGADRAEEYATSSRSITDSEFDQISFAVIKVERELKAILAGPSYAVQRAMATV